MSIDVTSHVWRESKHKGTALLLMLAIADHAHDDGGGAYPSIATLAKKARTTTRNVRLLLPKLKESGELSVNRGAGPKGCNTYRVNGVSARGEESSGGDEESGVLTVKDLPMGGENTDTWGGKRASPEPSVESSREPSEKLPAAEDLPDDATASCLLLLRKVEGFPRDQGKVALAVAELRAEFPDADPLQVCRDYEWKHRNGTKSKNHLARLRAFFKNDHERSGRPHGGRGSVTPLRGGATSVGERYAAEGY